MKLNIEVNADDRKLFTQDGSLPNKRQSEKLIEEALQNYLLFKQANELDMNDFLLAQRVTLFLDWDLTDTSDREAASVWLFKFVQGFIASLVDHRKTDG